MSGQRVRQLAFLPLLAGLVACGAAPSSESTDDAVAASSATEARVGQIVTEADYPDDVVVESRGRLPTPSRDMFTASEDLDAWDAIVYPGSRWENGPTTQVAMLGYSPPLAEAFAKMSNHVRFNNALGPRLTEVGILAIARELRSAYVWTSHEPLALEAGAGEDVVNFLRDRGLLAAAEGAGLGPEERLIVQFVREAINEEKVPSETFQQARNLFGERGLTDLVGLLGHYNVVNMVNKSFDLQRAVGDELLLPDLW